MNLETKISQAKAKLLVEHPYFGTLASKLELVVNDNIESFKSSGVKVEYREDYLAELQPQEIAFILANGAMHAALAHESRKNNRSGWLWQMATDIAINDMLLANGMQMPYGSQYRKRFAGMYAEEIYAELKDDILREDEDLEYEADSSDDVQKEQNPSLTQEQEIVQEQLLAEEATSLLESELKQGSAPESIERFFKMHGISKMDWREVLREALAKYFYDDYTMMPPSKKLLYQNIYLPSSTSQTFRLVIAIDSSGSIDEELLDTFLTEVNFIMEQTQNYVIDLLVCDDKIHSHAIFTSGEKLEVKLIGGGGTDFRPVFKRIEQEMDDVKLLLYFSDLEGVFPKEVPPYSVKWITLLEKEVLFGEVITLK